MSSDRNGRPISAHPRIRQTLAIGLVALVTLSVSSTALAGWTAADKENPQQTLTIGGPTDPIRAYLWLPDDYDPRNRYRAVVLAHGCGGAHWKDNPWEWNAQGIAGKYRVWGKLLSERDVMVLLVDSFTTRDVGGDVGPGVCDIPYDTRPAKIDPISVRPKDIAVGIEYLNSRTDVQFGQVGVLGYSNGGTAALALASHGVLAPFGVPFTAQHKASRVIALYPGCGMRGYQPSTQGLYDTLFQTYTDTYVFAASDDTKLPSNYLQACDDLEALDAGLNYWVVDDTDHEFDYYENGEVAVDAVILTTLDLLD